MCAAIFAAVMVRSHEQPSSRHTATDTAIVCMCVCSSGLWELFAVGCTHDHARIALTERTNAFATYWLLPANGNDAILPPHFRFERHFANRIDTRTRTLLLFIIFHTDRNMLPQYFHRRIFIFLSFSIPNKQRSMFVLRSNLNGLVVGFWCCSVFVACVCFCGVSNFAVAQSGCGALSPLEPDDTKCPHVWRHGLYNVYDGISVNNVRASHKLAYENCVHANVQTNVCGLMRMWAWLNYINNIDAVAWCCGRRFWVGERMRSEMIQWRQRQNTTAINHMKSCAVNPSRE